MNSRELSRLRHKTRKSLPNGMTWSEFDDLVFKTISDKELYRKLAGDVTRITFHQIMKDLGFDSHPVQHFIGLCDSELVRTKRIAPDTFNVMTMKRAEGLANQYGCTISELFKHHRQ